MIAASILEGLVGGGLVGGLALWIGQAMIARNADKTVADIAKLDREHEVKLRDLQAKIDAAQSEIVSLRDHRAYVSRAFFDLEFKTYLDLIELSHEIHMDLVTLVPDLQAIHEGRRSSDEIREIESKTQSLIKRGVASLKVKSTLFVLVPQNIGVEYAALQSQLLKCLESLLKNGAKLSGLDSVNHELDVATKMHENLATAIRERLQSLKVLD